MICELADRYKTSILSSALRTIQLSHFPCALAAIRNGTLAWTRCSSIELVDLQLDQDSRIPGVKSYRTSQNSVDALLESASIMQQMDLVIAINSPMAHLGGALDVATWVIQPSNSNWTWLVDRDDSPWYRSIRLFRQTEAENWKHVIDHVIDALKLQFSA